MKKTITLLTLFITVSLGIYANDVLVTSVSLVGQTTIGPLNTHYTNAQFTIAWKNSWRTSTNESNYDGCWIFVKYRKQSTSVWQHATLNISGHTAATGSILQSTAEGTGRTYTGLHGDGMLNALAEANTANWPTNATSQFNILFRGGDFNGSPTFLQTSARNGTNVFDNGTANTFLGGRGVRTGE